MERQREINVAKYVEGRASDIAQLLSVIDNSFLPAGEVSQGSKTHVQRLPRHMRRRAMSYCVKRMPLKDRLAAAAMTAKSTHRKKPPSRKYRRRAGRLLKHTWLETHIWHAKRFHMVKPSWATWPLPLRPTQRSGRPIYRDCVNHTVVADISFMVCFQLQGNQENIVALMSAFAPREIGRTFAAKPTLDSSSQGTTTVYRSGEYPSSPIGPVSFIWGPQRLWIWAHPVSAEELFSLLHEAVRSSSDLVKLVPFRRGFSRFRLLGPNSLTVINSSLPTVASNVLKNQQSSTAKWWSTLDANSLCKCPTNSDNYAQNCVIPLIIRDPRLYLQFCRERREAVRQKANDSKMSSSNVPLSFPNHVISSPLWDPEIRHRCASEQASTADLHERRNELLICDPVGFPAKQCQLTPQDDLVPIWLIKINHPCDGWDIIIPRGWGHVVWLALQYGTARAIGLENMRRLCLEFGAFDDVWACPDSKAGHRLWKELADERNAKYERKPRNRRPDFVALKVDYPFEFPFLTDGSYVLRDKILNVKIARKLLKSTDVEKIVGAHTNALLPVKIESVGSGVPKPNAMICLPANGDVTISHGQASSLANIVEEPTSSVAGTSVAQSEDDEENLMGDLLYDWNEKIRAQKKRKKMPELNFSGIATKMETDTRAPAEPKRAAVGYVTDGDYSFRIGKGAGLGFCYIRLLPHLVASKNVCYVLYCNANSKVYRLATLSVLL